MIRSMTGFGRAEVITSERKITVELKSVNHRYLDMNIKMPKKLSFFVNKKKLFTIILKKYCHLIVNGHRKSQESP